MSFIVLPHTLTFGIFYDFLPLGFPVGRSRQRICHSTNFDANFPILAIFKMKSDLLTNISYQFNMPMESRTVHLYFFFSLS
jgi:hypothetical protein